MMTILEMHAWLWNDKVKVKVHSEDLIHSIVPVAFQKGCPLCFTSSCQSYHVLGSTSNYLKHLCQQLSFNVHLFDEITFLQFHIHVQALYYCPDVPLPSLLLLQPHQPLSCILKSSKHFHTLGTFISCSLFPEPSSSRYMTLSHMTLSLLEGL